jgi:hypothetical protein
VSDSEIGDPNSYAGGADTGEVTSYSAPDYAAAEITPETAAEVATPDGLEQAISVRPHRDNGGISAMRDVLESLHTVETERSGLIRSSTSNVSPAHSAEIRYTADETDERTLSLQYIPGSRSLTSTFEGQLQTRYDDSLFDRTDPNFLPVESATGSADESNTASEESVYLSGATLALRKYTLFPIKNVSLPGFRSDPMGSIMQEMVSSQDDGAADADVVVQIMFRPEDRSWRQGVSGGHGLTDDDDPNITGENSLQELSFNLNQPTTKKERMTFTKERVEYPPSKVDKQIAKLLEEQQGDKGWHLCVRVFALSEDPEVAKSRAAKTAGMFENFYEANSEQTFVPQPIGKKYLTDEYADAAAREFNETGIVKAQREVAGLVNIPQAKDISTNKMQWSLSRPGDGVPVGTPRFDFDAVGLSDNASQEEKQAAMLDHSEAGDPFWFGFGRKNGTEVGVYEEYLNAHLMVTGGTRKGKTTNLTSFASQVYDRNYGALIIANGKEQDENRFIEEWPEDRPEEDFVFIDTGDDFDKRVRFNLLEIPANAEPGTNAFESAVNSLADDWSASFAEAGGGTDNYWGALMDRITRTVIKGLAKKRGEACTPLDIAAAVSTSAGLDQFRDWMTEDRIHFVQEAAERIAEKEDADLEPLAGRTDLLTQHAGLRNFMCARNPTASIQDFVREGKVCVLRLDPHLSESETKFMLTPLVRRFYTAKKTLPESPRFYLIWDEFDKAVSPMTNVHEMLSIAGGHDFRMVLSCQAPSNQVYDKLGNALQNQVDTAISFGTGEKDAQYIRSHHSFDDTNDLTNMGRFKFWLRTYYKRGNDEDTTYSYKVDAFPPCREVRQQVHGDDYEVNVEGMKRRSVERYGDVPETAEELKAASEFYGNEEADDDEDAETEVGASSLQRTQRLYEAAHTVQIRRDAVGEPVPYEAVVAELRRVVDDDLGSDNKVANLIEGTPDTELKKGKREGERVLTLTTEGLRNAGLTQDTGAPENGGGFEHRLVLAKAKAAFVKLRYDTWLPTQDSNEAADGMADLPIDPMATTDPSERRKREQELKDKYPHIWEFANEYNVSIEAETSTMDAPQQTLTNLRKAINSGRFCVFALKDETFGDPEQFDHWRERGEKIIFDTYREDGEVKIDYDTLTFANETDENGNRWFYNNKKRRLKIEDGVYALRPVREEGSTQIRWEEEYGEVVLRDTGVKEDREEVAPPQEYMRFDSPEAVADVGREDVVAYREYDQSEGVYVVRTEDGGREEYETQAAMKQNWQRIYAPFIPENEFRRTPTPDDFCFVVFPDADNPEYDEPQLAAKGEFEPLLPDDITMPETPEKLAEEGDDEDESSDKDKDEAEAEPEDEDVGEVEDAKPEENELIEAVASEIATRGVPKAQAAERTRQVLTGVDPTQLTKERAVTMVAPLFETDLSNPTKSAEEPSKMGESETAVPHEQSATENSSDAHDETESEPETKNESGLTPTASDGDQAQATANPSENDEEAEESDHGFMGLSS